MGSGPYEPERHVQDDELGLRYLLQGYFPVWAEGEVLDYPFYFRARGGGWEFDVAFNRAVDPASLTVGKEPGFIGEGEFKGFVLWGEYDNPLPHEWLPYDDAQRIIRDCAVRFREAMGTAAS